MSNVTLVDTITKGLNNPECSFFVGQSMGYSTAGMLITRVAIIYFGFKFLEWLIKWSYKKIRTRRLKNDNL